MYLVFCLYAESWSLSGCLVCNFYYAAANNLVANFEALLEFFGYLTFAKAFVLNMHYCVVDIGVEFCACTRRNLAYP